MPIPIVDKILHRSYEPAVDRALRFASAELGYEDLKIGKFGGLSYDKAAVFSNRDAMQGRLISTLRSQHSRAREIYVELSRKKAGNQRKKALFANNPVLLAREKTLDSLMTLIADHPFYKEETVKSAIAGSAKYGIADRAADNVKAVQKRTGLWLRENRATGVSLGIGVVALKLAIVYACAKHLLHSPRSQKQKNEVATTFPFAENTAIGSIS